MATTQESAAEPKYVYETTHRIYYNTTKPVPIKEVILALQGLEGVLKLVPKAVSTLTGIEIEGSEFLIQSIESGSLIEDVAIQFFFKDKANFEAFVVKMGQNKIVKTTVITAIIAGVIGYGLSQAMGTKPAPGITATNSVIIQNGAGTLNITPEAFAAGIKSAVTDKKGAAEGALKMLGPARAQPGSSVFLGGDAAKPDVYSEFEIPPNVVAEAPARIELAANERLEEFKNVKLAIRAANLDSKKNGWAGRLALREERLPIELDPAVQESEIFGRQEVMVNAALVYKEKGPSRELKPARIYVRQVLGAPPAGLAAPRIDPVK